MLKFYFVDDQKICYVQTRGWRSTDFTIAEENISKHILKLFVLSFVESGGDVWSVFDLGPTIFFFLLINESGFKTTA